MPSDRVNQILTLRDERSLSFAECGDPAGQVVFFFNGSGGSRLGGPADESILTDLAVRLVSTDRPGHGLSSPQPERALLDWPEDIGQLADHLGVDRFYVLGWSAGGPHALACAYMLPHRVIAGALVSGLAPPERPNPYQGMRFPNRVWMLGARRLPILVRLIRRMVYPMIMGDPQEAARKLVMFFAPTEGQYIDTTQDQERFVMDLREGYRQGWEGPVQDDIITNSPWGFRLEDITVRIDVWQGEIDANVPLNQGIYQHERLPNSRLTVLPGQGHLCLLAEWHAVLAALVG